MKDHTLCVHAGPGPDPQTGAVNTPIYATSTYAYAEFGRHRGWEYSRTANPTRVALEQAVAQLEGGADACAFASGMAAIDALTDLLQVGDHILAAHNLYGGTYRLFTTITARHGLEVSFVDATDLNLLEASFRPNTRMLFLESPTNPLMALVDLEAASQLAHRRGVLVVVDNTFLSPILQKPLALGADVVLHSTTKYLNGHSDGVGGVVVTKEAALGQELHRIQNSAGAILGPFDAYLVLRGIRTLAVRMAAHEAGGRAVAQFLAQHPKVQRVYYPGLPHHPQHALAQRQQRGFGAMVAFDLGSLEAAQTVCNRVRLFTLAESLGGVESLIAHPATMTHASVPPEERQKLGITEGLLRLSVGIEDPEDLVE
ncbi:MAG: PLP-dependent aspartate aminotransferase family protein, partial [Thermoanaerobaculum sp.]|nr:PLP-dependent aspartate aminotransferase family protein [Thermoanaerobaculum sp.]